MTLVTQTETERIMPFTAVVIGFTRSVIDFIRAVTKFSCDCKGLRKWLVVIISFTRAVIGIQFWSISPELSSICHVGMHGCHHHFCKNMLLLLSKSWKCSGDYNGFGGTHGKWKSCGCLGIWSLCMYINENADCLRAPSLYLIDRICHI